MAYVLMTVKQQKEFEENKEIDLAIFLPCIGRFRANFYLAMENIACAFRILSLEIPTLDGLSVKPILKNLVKYEQGLILVTGPTGSGKSTTIAAMINEINQNEAKHIITIEDPVEFVHQNKKSLFSQRSIGHDTKSFAQALKSAMREDPDVILIGEMRDRKTIEAALTAAETGHLVFSTLHTNSAPQTINRILDVFSGEEQQQIRSQLSLSLIAVVSQVLVPTLANGRLVVQEILHKNNAISNLIRDNNVHQMYSQMELNQTLTGMTTQTQELVKYVIEKYISKNVARQYSNRTEELNRLLTRI